MTTPQEDARQALIQLAREQGIKIGELLAMTGTEDFIAALAALSPPALPPE